jgi:hypothetical protein
MLGWALPQLVRSQGGEWNVFLASHAFHHDTLDEVVELTAANIVDDIPTVAGATNENVTRDMLQQG